MLLVKKNTRTLGVANYVDEAKEFAERLAQPAGVVRWNDGGELLVNGSPTGWSIWVVRDLEEVGA